MGSYLTKQAIESYIQTNWTQTTVQWEGVPFVTTGKTSWISVKYIGVDNEQHFSGRKYLNAQLQIRAYAESPTLAHKLIDEFSPTLSCKQIGDIEIRVGKQQGSALNLDNGIYEVLMTFEVDAHS